VSSDFFLRKGRTISGLYLLIFIYLIGILPLTSSGLISGLVDDSTNYFEANYIPTPTLLSP